MRLGEENVQPKFSDGNEGLLVEGRMYVLTQDCSNRQIIDRIYTRKVSIDVVPVHLLIVEPVHSRATYYMGSLSPGFLSAHSTSDNAIFRRSQGVDVLGTSYGTRFVVEWYLWKENSESFRPNSSGIGAFKKSCGSNSSEGCWSKGLDGFIA